MNSGVKVKEWFHTTKLLQDLQTFHYLCIPIQPQIDMIEIGIKGSRAMAVTEAESAKHIGSGTVLVLSTPMMIALIEKTCRLSVKPFLEEGQETVGTHVNVSHVAATPLGMSVRCETELIEVERRKLVFKVAVSDEDGLVGEGTHERFIIDEARFQSKAEAKKSK